MKKEIKVQLIIEASVDKVWDILVDFDQYSLWSPTIKSFQGIPKVGQRTTLRLEQPDSYGMTMKPIFLKINPQEELRWKGRLFMDGLFDGEHYFILEKIANDKTLFTQGEIFSGLFIRFFKSMIDGPTVKGFELFNQALKSRAELELTNIDSNHLFPHV